MLEIRVNNQALELAPGTDVQITGSNPILDKDAISRTFSYPFKVPASPNNRRARQHRNRLDSAYNTKSQPGSLSFQSHRLVTGLVEQTGFSRQQEEIVCVSRPMKIMEALGKIKINEILETIDVTAGLPDPVWTFFLDPPNPIIIPIEPFVISIEGLAFFATANNPSEIQAAGESLAAQINAAFFTTVATYNVIPTTLTIDANFLALHPITFINQLVLQSYENPALFQANAMTAHVNAVNATPVETHCFPVIRWENAYSGKLYMPRELANAAWNGNLIVNEKYDTEYDQWQNTLIPCVRIPYILSRIATVLGTHTFGGDVLNETEFQALILANNYALDEVVRSQYSDLKYYKLNCFKKVINLNKHVPQLTAAALIERICTTFALYIDISEDQIIFKKKRDRITAPAIDIRNEIDIEYTVTANRIDGWTLAHLKNEKEELPKPGQFTDIVFEGGEALTQINQSFFMGEYTLFGTTKMPATRQPLLSNVFDTGTSNTSLPFTLLYFFGNQPGGASITYPFASSDNRNQAGKYLGRYTLDISGPDGLYNQWHQGVIETSVADTITTTAYLTIGQLQKLLTWSSARLRFYHPEGAVTGILKSIQASLKTGWRIVAKLEILRP